MKKVICLTLAIVLALSMCIPALARFDQCKNCESTTLRTKSRETEIGTQQCDVDPSKTDTVYWVEYVAYCPNCGYEKVLDEYEEVRCRH